jgi:membrane protein DedA with SNARE-associated domain
VLSYIGYFIGENQELIMKYSHQALIGVVVASVVIIAVYIRNYRRKKQKAEMPSIDK